MAKRHRRKHSQKNRSNSNRSRHHKSRKLNIKHQKKPKSNLKKSFYKSRKFILRHPLISSVGSILVSILLFRASLSNKIFGNNISEFRGWFLFFAFLIGLIGVIALMVWFKRNVPALFTKHDINWKKR